MKNLLMAVITVSILSACASSELVTSQIDNAAMKQASEANVTPEQAIEKARAVLANANRDNLSYYTPLHFKDAQASLKKIEMLQQNKADGKSVDGDLALITEAFKTQELISKAYEVKKTIEGTLSASLNHKIILDELGCKKEFPKDYNNIDKDLIDLFKLIEQNKVEKARQNEAELLADMTELEIDTLVKIYITPASFILDKAEDYDADDYAEKTFEHAELAIERANAFIKTNYRKRDEVKLVANEAVIAAKKALNTGKLSKSMVELDEENAELKALEMEALLETVIRGFEADGLQGLTLQEQAQELANLARSQNVKINQLTAPLAIVSETANENTADQVLNQEAVDEATSDSNQTRVITLLGTAEESTDIGDDAEAL